MTKICSTCKLLQPKSFFSKDKTRKDGLQLKCKSCYKNYVKVNKEKIASYMKDYRRTHQEERASYMKEYYELNKCGIATYQKKYHEAHKEQRASGEKQRYRTDLQFRLAKNLRARLNNALNDNYKTGSAVADLGCSVEELKKHLESKFEPGMTWNNWSKEGWHIDHIRPLSSFDLSDPEQLKEACNYKNLQPLWAKDNISKSDKYGL